MLWEEDDILDFKGLKKSLEELMDQSDLQETLKYQLVEFKMLMSMFFNSGEFEVEDPRIVDGVEAFVEGRSNYLPARLTYSINLTIDGDKLKVCVDLPPDYPVEVPEIFVWCDSLTALHQRALNDDLMKYVSSLTGDICVQPSVAWLQENASRYLLSSAVAMRFQTKKPTRNIHYGRKFFRNWIFSFCPQNQMKVKSILELAEACHVTGFCLIGRPTIMCVEGFKSECADWWQRVRQMNWKKITCKRREEKIIDSDEDLESFRKFKGFREISFNGGKREKWQQPDMGGFRKYLAQHGCSYAFQDYFRGCCETDDKPTR